MSAPAARTPSRILIIAGSDSSGGAGIQADIKTVTMLGGYAMTAITAITAQNSHGVQAIDAVDANLVGTQIDSCLSDIGADAVKIGMLGSPEIVNAVADRLKDLTIPIVLDPVMVATSGAELAAGETIAAMRKRLFPLAILLTPNLPELAALTGIGLTDGESIHAAATLLVQTENVAVLAKGGHRQDDETDTAQARRIRDLFVPVGGRWAEFENERIDTRHTHGTGCTLSSAIATMLGHGLPMEHAIRLARQFVLSAIEQAPGFGQGHGPLGHQAVRSLD